MRFGEPRRGPRRQLRTAEVREEQEEEGRTRSPDPRDRVQRHGTATPDAEVATEVAARTNSRPSNDAHGEPAGAKMPTSPGAGLPHDADSRAARKPSAAEIAARIRREESKKKATWSSSSSDEDEHARLPSEPTFPRWEGVMRDVRGRMRWRARSRGLLHGLAVSPPLDRGLGRVCRSRYGGRCSRGRDRTGQDGRTCLPTVTAPSRQTFVINSPETRTGTDSCMKRQGHLQSRNATCGGGRKREEGGGKRRPTIHSSSKDLEKEITI